MSSSDMPTADSAEAPLQGTSSSASRSVALPWRSPEGLNISLSATVVCLVVFLFASMIVTYLIEWRLGIRISAVRHEDIRGRFWMSVGGSAAQGVAMVFCFVLASASMTGGWRRILTGASVSGKRALAALIGGFVVAMAAAYPALWATLWIITQLNSGYSPEEHAVVRLIRSGELSFREVAMLWAGAAVVAPLAEEVFFRGLLQTALFRRFRRRMVAIFVAAMLFGVAHGTAPESIPAMIVLGVVLGVAYELTDALLVPVGIHALFNLATLVALALGVT